MSLPRLAGVHHVKIPVTDLARSRDWYGRVFGFRVTWEFPDEEGVARGVAGEVPGFGDTILALRENPQAARGSKGFDPVGFAVADRADSRLRTEPTRRPGRRIWTLSGSPTHP